MTLMKPSGKTVLLFNPWIYDFAAYDFWIKPIGLLTIGALLRRFGYRVHLIDCLDRHHPALGEAHDKPDGSGKFIREPIEKPEVLRSVPRRWCRYGMPPNVVAELFDALPPPDLILITSVMTYWYPAVRDAAALLRRRFPRAVILLGGIYATLCPDHARAVVQPDEVIVGEGEEAVLHRAAAVTGGSGADFSYSSLDELPFPAFDLYPRLSSAALLTSRGCPNACSFCASRLLTRGYRRRSPENVLAEIEGLVSLGVRNLAFFDDALLLQSEIGIKPILRGLAERRLPLRLHTPNGLTPRFIDEETAQLFKEAGVETIRLSFETSNPDRQRSMSSKVTTDELKGALDRLEAAGYRRRDIGVYVLMGLPGQPPEEFRNSARLVHDLGARVYPAAFSPIPHTVEWRRAVEAGLWNPNSDLLLTNTTLCPVWAGAYGYSFCVELLQWAKELNIALKTEKGEYADSEGH